MVGFDPQFVWNGIVAGSILAVGALGLTVIFGILNFIKVSYGEYMAISAFLTWSGIQAGIPFLASAVGAVVAVIGLSLLMDRVMFQHFRNRSAIILLVATIGLSLILRNGLRVVYGTRTKLIGEAKEATQIAGIYIGTEQAIIVMLSLGLLGVTEYVFHRTDIGIAMRAASDDLDLTQIRGIDTERLVLYVWVLSGAIAALAGIMFAIDATVRPTMGFFALIPMFAATILGGIGDPRGAVAGGFAMGIIQEVGIVIIPSEYKLAIAMSVMIVGLLVKPDGIFGEATR